MNRSAAPSLVLTVVGDQADELAGSACMRVDGHDLTIGRADHCDWVLHAHGVSRQHAVVRHLNGLYFLEDRSTNGMLLNGAPLRGGEPATLAHGDRVQIDTFEIQVAIDAPPKEDTVTATQPARRQAHETLPVMAAVNALPSVSPAYDPFAPGQGVTPTSMPSQPAPATPLDPLAWLDAPGAGSIADGIGVAEPSDHWNHASALEDRFGAPPVSAAPPRSAGGVLPEHWDRTQSQFTMPADAAAVPVPAPAPAPVTTTMQADAPPRAADAAASGDDPLRPLMLLMLEGVMDVLRARAELKNGFRMPATLIRRSENNPLKFAPTADEALARLQGPATEAFMEGRAAIVDAMDDIRLHQVALLAGVRAAFEDLIAQFDPARFEDEGERRPRFGFGGSDKGPWERYRRHYRQLAADPEDRFRRLFGDEFARAYEDQLARFKRDSEYAESRR